MEKTYTVSVFTENSIGMMNRVTIIFTRRHLNIDSITASESEVKGVFRYTIVLRTTREQVDKVIGQLEKLIDVFKAFVHEDSEVVHQEIADRKSTRLNSQSRPHLVCRLLLEK